MLDTPWPAIGIPIISILPSRRLNTTRLTGSILAASSHIIGRLTTSILIISTLITCVLLTRRLATSRLLVSILTILTLSFRGMCIVSTPLSHSGIIVSTLAHLSGIITSHFKRKEDLKQKILLNEKFLKRNRACTRTQGDFYSGECKDSGSRTEGRNEMDPPRCGSTAMSHNEFTIRELM